MCIFNEIHMINVNTDVIHMIHMVFHLSISETTKERCEMTESLGFTPQVR